MSQTDPSLRCPPPLAAAIRDATPDPAMEAVAAWLASGATVDQAARALIEEALQLSGGELSGASWGRAVLGVLACPALARELGDAAVASAMVGAAGFLAFARPSRSPLGSPEAPDGASLAGLAFGTLDGWGHPAVVLGHARRACARWPELAPSLIRGVAGLLARGPASQPVRDEVVVDASGATGAVDVAGLIAEAGAGRLTIRATREQLVGGLGLAALGLLAVAPDLRAVHHVLLLREALPQPPSLEPLALARTARFVADGWERARRDRRVRAAPVFGAPPADGPWDELLRAEPRPGFALNLLLAEAALELGRSLPAVASRWVGPAVVVTVPMWTRSRRPWLVLQGARAAV